MEVNEWHWEGRSHRVYPMKYVHGLLCFVLLCSTHWGRVMHICINKLTIIGSDNGLSPGRRQAIIWTNAGISLIGPLGTNFSEILIGIFIFYTTFGPLQLDSIIKQYDVNTLRVRLLILKRIKSIAWNVFSNLFKLCSPFLIIISVKVLSTSHSHKCITTFGVKMSTWNYLHESLIHPKLNVEWKFMVRDEVWYKRFRLKMPLYLQGLIHHIIQCHLISGTVFEITNNLSKFEILVGVSTYTEHNVAIISSISMHVVFPMSTSPTHIMTESGWNWSWCYSHTISLMTARPSKGFVDWKMKDLLRNVTVID